MEIVRADNLNEVGKRMIKNANHLRANALAKDFLTAMPSDRETAFLTLAILQANMMSIMVKPTADADVLAAVNGVMRSILKQFRGDK